MDDANYEFDVAFSFHTLDESLATQLNDLLADRMKTFIYAERQKQIAGKDGQETFSNVYGKAARLVVVLFRQEWGETPWTRVERDAIRQRAFEDGWDFTTFIPTTEKPTMPQWLPKTRLYVGLHRFGLEGAAAVIESRVTELGGCPQEETIKSRAERFARAKHLTEQQRNFLNSETGVRAATAAYDEFSDAIEKSAADMETVGIRLRAQRSQELRIVRGIAPINLIAKFCPRYSNVLEGAYLTLTYYKGFPRMSGFYSFDEATKLRELKYSYEMVGIDRYAYVGLDVNKREFSPEQLADHALQEYLNVAEKHPLY